MILGVDRPWAGHERVTGLRVTSSCPGYMVSEVGEPGSMVLSKSRIKVRGIARMSLSGSLGVVSRTFCMNMFC